MPSSIETDVLLGNQPFLVIGGNQVLHAAARFMAGADPLWAGRPIDCAMQPDPGPCYAYRPGPERSPALKLITAPDHRAVVPCPPGALADGDLDQRWRGSGGVSLDGTNNATERAIGWWIKERYRTMRTYKRRESVLNVSNLISYLGANSGVISLASLLSA